MPIKTSIKICYALKNFLVLLLLGFVVACAAAPSKNADININHNLGEITALDNTKVIIHIQPEDRKKVYTVQAPLGVNIRWRLMEGLIIESAAIKTFSKVFKKVTSSEHSRIANLVITILRPV